MSFNIGNIGNDNNDNRISNNSNDNEIERVSVRINNFKVQEEIFTSFDYIFIRIATLLTTSNNLSRYFIFSSACLSSHQHHLLKAILSYYMSEDP